MKHGGRSPSRRAKSIVGRTRFLDKIIRQLPTGHVVVPLGKVIRHAPTPFASVILDVVGEFADSAAGGAARILQKGAEPPDAAVTLDAHARDLLTVAVPAIAIDATDAAGEPAGDAPSAGAIGRSATVDAEGSSEVEESGGEEDDLERGYSAEQMHVDGNLDSVSEVNEVCREGVLAGVPDTLFKDKNEREVVRPISRQDWSDKVSVPPRTPVADSMHSE